MISEATVAWEDLVRSLEPTIAGQVLHWTSAHTRDATTPDEFLMREGDDLIVLLRKTTERNLRGSCPATNCLSIVGVYLPERMQSKGWFKAFLKFLIAVNPWPLLAIELVINPRLLAYCQRLGFETPDPDDETTFLIDASAVV